MTDHHFRNTALHPQGHFDLLLNCASAKIDAGQLMSLLKNNGTVVQVGAWVAGGLGGRRGRVGGWGCGASLAGAVLGVCVCKACVWEEEQLRGAVHNAIPASLLSYSLIPAP